MTAQTTLLVTGGAGFIGANFVLDWIASTGDSVLNLDALTYAGNRESLASLDAEPRHRFVHGDILDRALLDELFARHRPRAVVHFGSGAGTVDSLTMPKRLGCCEIASTRSRMKGSENDTHSAPS